MMISLTDHKKEEGEQVDTNLYPDHDRKMEAQKKLAGAPKAGDVYRHYKGGLYDVVASALMEETLMPCVVYRSRKYGTTWIRTLANWRDSVVIDETDVPRFERVGGQEP